MSRITKPDGIHRNPEWDEVWTRGMRAWMFDGIGSSARGVTGKEPFLTHTSISPVITTEGRAADNPGSPALMSAGSDLSMDASTAITWRLRVIFDGTAGTYLGGMQRTTANPSYQYILQYWSGVLYASIGKASDDDLNFTWTPTLGQVYDLVLRYDGATLKLFIDGIEVASKASTGTLTAAATRKFELGHITKTGGNHFDGKFLLAQAWLNEAKSPGLIKRLADAPYEWLRKDTSAIVRPPVSFGNLIVDITGDTLVAEGAAFDAVRRDIINGISGP